MSKQHTNGNGAHRTKKSLNVWAEPEFFDTLDRLRKAEKPVLTRSQMVQRLIFQVAESATSKHRSAA